jgi:hypothetical protein
MKQFTEEQIEAARSEKRRILLEGNTLQRTCFMAGEIIAYADMQPTTPMIPLSEALVFAEWTDTNTCFKTKKNRWAVFTSEESYTTEELYNKFKEEQK